MVHWAVTSWMKSLSTLANSFSEIKWGKILYLTLLVNQERPMDAVESLELFESPMKKLCQLSCRWKPTRDHAGRHQRMFGLGWLWLTLIGCRDHTSPRKWLGQVMLREMDTKTAQSRFIDRTFSIWWFLVFYFLIYKFRIIYPTS